ncbi:molybdate ABC transporter substrate-binding protein [Thermomicrobiaceae bacterium CFH 74404]|uniref:Molybdate ABC transporter substrate-binding protein n=1 Tax=Thermalbibacter longus TaxID=2951981 RepID=A0AA42BA51_9BACT|nr:molybdate ABC transporter substrate-binding protein [Thermalbibacter longus]MCM8749267.1 molybdate ABC transporter substrate-binding protein [Thermalbibacter longus]
MTATQLRLLFPGAFREIAETIRTAFAREAPGIELTFHPFLPSGMLAQAVLEGTEVDIVVSANWAFMDWLREVGIVPEPRVFAGNRLCVIALPDARPPVTGVDSLAQPGLRLVVSQPITDPCGQYVRAFFARAGIVEAMREKARRGELVHTRGSADLPAALFDGRADAGILYLSEARRLAGRLRVIALPEGLDLHDQIRFTAGTVARGGSQKPEAERFLRFLTGDPGQMLLEAAGFLPLARLSGGVEDG